ncbi:MAG: PilZ domain-containing protein [Candidatus Omnitrophica bacterium]|nr:PilZ domain-containing protein [Candidatus Omnitrophota bacterium]
MNKNYQEKRAYPRIKANLKLKFSPKSAGDSIDLSEGGVSFVASQVISSPEISLQINFPGKTSKIKTTAKLAWRKTVDNGNTIYGLEFTGLNENEKTSLRKELIKAQISQLLRDIRKSDARLLVRDFFTKDMFEYITEITRLIPGTYTDKTYLPELESIIEQLNNKILLKGYSLELILADKKTTQRIKDNFRRLVDAWIYKSIIVKQAFDKPRGYSEDHRALEFIYSNKPVSQNIGLYFDNIFLKSPYAVAARSRKDRLKNLITEFIHETPASPVHILSIACSCCREIRELLLSLKTEKTVIFRCLDWDGEALKFSAEAFANQQFPNIKFHFSHLQGVNIERNKQIAHLPVKQNLIYSIGLIDYLPDRVLKKLIFALFQVLEKNGKIIMTHKNREKTIPPICPDWFCDWKFVSRTKDDVRKLFLDSGIPNSALILESDNFGYIYFFIVTKE